MNSTTSSDHLLHLHLNHAQLSPPPPRLTEYSIIKHPPPPRNAKSKAKKKLLTSSSSRSIKRNVHAQQPTNYNKRNQSDSESQLLLNEQGSQQIRLAIYNHHHHQIKGEKKKSVLMTMVPNSKSNPAASPHATKTPLSSKLTRTRSSRPVRLFSTSSSSSRASSSFRSRPSMKMMKKNKRLVGVVNTTTTSSTLNEDRLSESTHQSSNATKPTCSSKFKTAIFPTRGAAGDDDHTQPSSSSSSNKVCPYSYCSLHGRHRQSENPPQLRRFVSLSRRRGPLLRPQKRAAIKPAALLLYHQLQQPNSSPLSSSLNLKAEESAHHHGIPANVDTQTENSVVEDKGKNLVRAKWYMSQEGLRPLKDDDHSISICCSQKFQAQERDDGEVSPPADYLLLPKSTITDLEEMNEDYCYQDKMSATHDTQKSNQGNKKRTRIWRLIYYSILSARHRSELYPPKADDDSDSNVDATAGASYPKVTSRGIYNADLQIIDNSQMDAIKLVEEAIDDILLPDLGDHQLSENQPLTGSKMESEEGLLLSNQHHLPCMVTNNSGPVEKLKDDGKITFKTDTAKKVKLFSKLGSESISKNWSKLKQVVLLKRFVKALDKVRELKLKDPKQLVTDPDPELEKINLRHQTTDEKKLADEWMLDYALRQAVAKLTPARRKKVELLIEAFETVIPLSETETLRNQYKPVSTDPRFSSPLPTKYTLLSSDEFTELTQESFSVAEDLENLVAEAPSIVLREEKIVARDLGHENESLTSLKQPLEEDISCFLQQKTASEDAPVVHNEFISKVPNTNTLEHMSLSMYDQSSAEPVSRYDHDPHAPRENNSRPYTTCLPSIASYNLEATKMTREASDLSQECLQQLPLPSDPMKHAENDTQLDNQNYLKMWGMIYNHVVSGNAAKIGNQLHIIGSNDKEGASDSRLDVVKLVEDALDEMLLPEYQDQLTDERSITSDQHDIERVDNESGDSEISTPKDPYHHYFKDSNEMKTNTAGETWRKADITIHTEQPYIPERAGNMTNRLKTNGWSNLKKFILLKRFIRAVEKLKKNNPREPRCLLVESGPEPEKVSLRRQTTDERLSADQWMIDHAIQQVVARLTPARKRRVELLVEAFETVEAVLPKSKTRTPLKHSTASPHFPSIVSMPR